MDQGTVYIGTSGWSYKHWKGNFYPQTLAAAKYLKFYSQHFDAVELNNTFYKLPLAKTVINWVEQVPPTFKICPKFNRYLTHFKKLNDPGSSLEKFFTVFEVMADLLGPVLLQLPESLPFNFSTVHDFYQILQAKYRSYRFAIEPRHPTWFAPESIALMTQFNVSLVQAQSKRFIAHEAITAKDVYVRLHGPAKLYDSSYSRSELLEFARKIRQWRQKQCNVWVFFNNDLHGYAIENANTLKCILGEKQEE